ncbi:MAG: F0F1 ATP synthase assembly protein I [Sphingobacteriia bacterium]|nr:F0F1 ATP synthase assembly protein I [Sphingobacteriia bacterium]NCC38383.1 F0F1 ATP synthase assembly protein I [Gammaproteobacteria bacterium]
MHQRNAFQARRILKLQMIFALVALAIALPFGASIVLSALVGAGSCLIANAMFAALVFRAYRAQEPARLVLRIYSAEILKLGMILALFTIAFVTLDGLNLPTLVGAYLAVQVIPTLVAAQLPERSTK